MSLDAAIARIQGFETIEIGTKVYIDSGVGRRLYRPSTSWHDAGPILESLGADLREIMRLYAAGKVVKILVVSAAEISATSAE